VSRLRATLQAFFIHRLAQQRAASPHTVAAYRDTFRLLLSFCQQRTGRKPSDLSFDDLNAEVVGAFLEHTERDRGNSIRTVTLVLPPTIPSSRTQRSSIPNTPD
jgi:integrase/recombinase XerD